MFHSLIEFGQCRPRSVAGVIFSSTNRSSSSKKKNGAIFKTLNKQNKTLFGKLLETKSERRKRIAVTIPSISSELKTAECQQDCSSEMHWIERLRSQKTVFPRVTRSKLQCSSANEVSLNISKKNEPEIVPMTDSGNECSPVKSLSQNNCQVADQRTDMCPSVSCENAVEAPIFQLPEIIVRNIPSFPLQNEKKQLSEDLSVGNILNLSHEKMDKYSHMYPSVSKILNATMSEGSKLALKRWRQKMIAELGQEEFLKYYRGLLARGSLFHSTIQRFLTGTSEEQLQLDPAVEGCWHSLSSIIPNLGSVYALESHVVHSRLKYRGIVDCVAKYQNKPVVIEWKKSDTQKPEIRNTYDAPMQLVAYLGAMNYDERYSFQVKGGLVVVAYSDGSPAHVFPLNAADCNKYWRLWLARVQQYWQLPAESRSISEQEQS